MDDDDGDDEEEGGGDGGGGGDSGVDLLCSEMLADHIDHTSFQLMIPQSQFRCLILLRVSHLR